MLQLLTSSHGGLHTCYPTLEITYFILHTYRLCTICYASHSVRVYIHITKHKYVHNIYREEREERERDRESEREGGNTPAPQPWRKKRERESISCTVGGTRTLITPCRKPHNKLGGPCGRGASHASYARQKKREREREAIPAQLPCPVLTYKTGQGPQA